MTEKMAELGFRQIDVKSLDMNVFGTIGDRWMLITAGNEERSNTMTASWGQMGILWNKTVATAYIRKTRYTKEFVDSGELFTLSVYPDNAELKKALGFCGSKSGRDYPDKGKAEAAGLTAMSVDGSVAYEQAELIFVCKKLYSYDINADGFFDKSIIDAQYSDDNWHTAYIAEITAAYVK